MKTIKYIIIALFASLSAATANKERPMSVEEMEQKATLVAVGEVIEIRNIRTIVRNDVEFKEMEASFKVSTPSKGNSKTGQIWTLKYTQVSDPRYKGDRVTAFTKGEFLIVYGRNTETNAEGNVIVHLSSANDVRKSQVQPQK